MTQHATHFQDNEATIRILHNKSNKARTKHIALRYNMIQSLFKTVSLLSNIFQLIL